MDSILRRAAKIRLLICDIDGVFTDGSLYLSEAGEHLKAFHIHDGLGIKMLLKTGIAVAIITARNSPIVSNRMSALGIKHIFQGHENKVVPYEQLLQELQLNEEQIAYIGDDLPDLAVIKRVGLAMTVANAVAVVKQHAHWQSKLSGGQGAVREACELLMLAQNTLHLAHADYL